MIEQTVDKEIHVDVTTPRGRVNAVGKFIDSICEQAGEDAADAITVLLVTAAIIAITNSDQDTDVVEMLTSQMKACVDLGRQWLSGPQKGETVQ